MISKSRLIREFSEFNLQRMNDDSVQPGLHADNPQLSTNAFDKHQDNIRQAISRIGDITSSLGGSSSYRLLKSTLSLEDQNIESLRIIRVSESQGFDYDVYISFFVKEIEYWGVIKNIMTSPELKSEIFNDHSLIQTKEWTVRLKGVIVKEIKGWMKPQYGEFRLIGDDINCYSSETGKIMVLSTGSIIEVLKSYDDRIVFRVGSDQYTLKGGNFIYFNWRFEEVKGK